jgi:thymidylate synthase (FAD)
MTSSSYGFVELSGHMADDASVVNSARVSFSRQIDDLSELSDADKGLINFLMRERHGTPFEHNSMRFHVKCPIFVAREWFRHRIGSFNEFSARYSEVPNSFWAPEEYQVRTQTGKPGAYTFLPMGDEMGKEVAKTISDHNNRSYGTYRYLIETGVAKEIARAVLPVSMYTEFYWTVNARSLMNFCSLRSAETAQEEIREYSQDVEKIFSLLMPVTYKAWIDNGRIAP